MHRRTWLKVIGVGPLVVTTLAHSAPAAVIPLPKVGRPMRLLDVPLINGGTFSAANAEGHVTLVYWWASWCPFCAIQNPYIQKLWDTQHTRGMKMLAISIDKKIEAPRAYMAQKGYTFPSGIMGPEIEAVLPKPSEGLPVTCMRGKDGRVLFAEAGQLFPEDVAGLARFV